MINGDKFEVNERGIVIVRQLDRDITEERMIIPKDVFIEAFNKYCKKEEY